MLTQFHSKFFQHCSDGHPSDARDRVPYTVEDHLGTWDRVPYMTYIYTFPGTNMVTWSGKPPVGLVEKHGLPNSGPWHPRNHVSSRECRYDLFTVMFTRPCRHPKGHANSHRGVWKRLDAATAAPTAARLHCLSPNQEKEQPMLEEHPMLDMILERCRSKVTSGLERLNIPRNLAEEKRQGMINLCQKRWRVLEVHHLPKQQLHWCCSPLWGVS